MHIEVGRYAGFCRGVKHAVDGALACAREAEGKVYSDGELIHNPQTLRLLEQHDVDVMRTPEDLERARGSTVIVRAHGVTPARLAELRATAGRVRNLTCPDVGRVQGIIRNRSNKGKSVVIFGKKDHPEVQGLLGYALHGMVVSSADEVGSLPPLDDVLVVSQTTMSKTAFHAVAEAIRARYGSVEIVDTICDATERRQEEVRDLARRNDLVLVIGSPSSSNTRRLFEIAAETTTAHLVTDATDVHTLDLGGAERVAVTAGASTPDWLIQDVVSEIRDRARGPAARQLRAVLMFALNSKLVVAAGAFLLSLAVADIVGVRFSPDIAVLASLYYLSMTLLNTYTYRASLRLDDPQRFRFIRRARHLFLLMFLGSLLGTVALAAPLGPDILALTLVSLALGVGYNLSYLTQSSERHRLMFVRTRDLLALKSLVISVAVSVLLNGLALLKHYPGVPSDLSSAADVLGGLGFYFSVAYVFLLMFTRQALLEMKTAQTDRIAGVASLLNLVSRRQLSLLLYVLPTLLLAAMVVGVLTGAYPAEKAKYFVAVGYNYLLVLLVRNRRFLASHLLFEVVVESNLFVAGLIALL